jgi:O-antigen/teichoic acid export membrane protein
MGTLFGVMYYMVQTGAYIARRTSVIALTMAAGALANILLNIALIPRFGILGAAFAMAIGHLTALVGLYAVAQRIAPIPYQPVKLIATVLAAVAVIVLAAHLEANSLGRDVLLKMLFLGFYGIALFATRALTPGDLALFRNMNSRILQRRDART